MSIETQVKTAAKLLNTRDTVKRLYQEKYLENLKPYMHLIKEVMKENKIDNELTALLRISETHAYKENAIGQMLFIAATAELIDPSV